MKAGKEWLRRGGVTHAFRPTHPSTSICGEVQRAECSNDLQPAGATCKACADAPFEYDP